MSLGLAIGTTILFYKYYTLGNSAAFEEKDSHSSQDFFALSSSRPTCWINASKDCFMSIWKVSNLCFNSWSSKQSNWQCYQNTIRNLPSVLQNDYISLHGGCLHEKTCTGASFILGWLFDFISRLLNDQVISYLTIWRYTSWRENTWVIQNRKHYTCATCCSLPADQFHTKTCGCFPVKWYCCEVL